MSSTSDYELSVEYQLSVQRQQLAPTGRLTLRGPGVNDSSLKTLGTQPRLRFLDVSGTLLTSLESLPAQPALQVITADKTKIAAFTGLARHPHLREVSFSDAPISKEENFRLRCLIVVGQRLAKINGRAVRPEERQVAKDYPVIARQLVEVGWNVERPVPPANRFRELAKQYRLKFQGANANFTNMEAEKYFKPPPALPCAVPQAEQEGGVSLFDLDDSQGSQTLESPEAADLVARISEQLQRIGLSVPEEEGAVYAAVSRLGEILKSLQYPKELTGTLEEEEVLNQEEEEVSE
jgi:hypothetical protein